MEIALLFWLLCGIAAAVIGSNRGRSGCGWFVLGILLGPFGVLFAAISSDKKVEAAVHAAAIKEHVEAINSKKCPYCAESIRAEAIVCRYCGKDQPARAPVISEDERFELWLQNQKPPVVNPGAEYRTQLRAAFDYKRKVKEL